MSWFEWVTVITAGIFGVACLIQSVTDKDFETRIGSLLFAIVYGMCIVAICT